jgi:hypothetical protein
MGKFISMRGRRASSVDQARQALEEAQAAREKLAEEIAAAHGRRHQLADDQAGYLAGEAEISRLQSEHRRLGLLAARCEADVEEAQKAAARSAWETAGKELKQAYGPRRSASEAVASALAALNHAVAALGDERERVKAGEDRFRALVPSDVDDWSYPSGCDEVTWGRLEEDVVELLRAGARTPEADGAESSARRAEDMRQAEQRRVPDMVQRILRGGGETWEQFKRDFLTLDVEERAEALRGAEMSLPAIEEEVLDRYRHPLSTFGPETDVARRDVERIVGMIRGRIDRLRELVAEVEVAA